MVEIDIGTEMYQVQVFEDMPTIMFDNRTYGQGKQSVTRENIGVIDGVVGWRWRIVGGWQSKRGNGKRKF